MMVAFLRALADRGHTSAQVFTDPHAAAMLPGRWRRMIPVAHALARLPGAWRVAHLLDPIPLRMLVGDQEIAAAVAAGTDRLVILGAGLDTRAHRLPGLEHVDVLEVDHPNTQAWKRRHAADLPITARSLAYVPVDFERQTLADGLAGYAPTRTVWVWEGVIMYLTDAALEATLADVARCSTPGSVLVAHYHQAGRWDASAVAAYAAWVGEPMVGTRSPDQMAAFLDAAGFDVVDDLGNDAWALRTGARRPVGDIGRVGRIVVARVRDTLSGA